MIGDTVESRVPSSGLLGILEHVIMARMNDRSDSSFTLPTKKCNTKVRIRCVSRTNQGMMDNLLSGGMKDLIRKGMTTLIRDTNNVINSFNRVRWKVTIHFLIVDFLPKMKAKEDADIRSVTIYLLQRNTLDVVIVGRNTHIKDTTTRYNHGHQYGQGYGWKSI
jgi:hypothetical protein